MRGWRAAATAAMFVAALGDLSLRPRAPTVIPRRSDIAAVRRFGVRAPRAAMVASLWAEETAGQCVFASNYGPPADFGRIAKLVLRRDPAKAAAGARALWAQMRSAGFEFADDPEAVDRLASAASAVVAVRALGEIGPPRRRAAETRRAA
ncbi:MAG: hypothetical protein GC189_04735 [Alphaproteobacteria bacterium]|nr:hypothetical protein [Alphaproteobacteria bacterium]